MTTYSQEVIDELHALQADHERLREQLDRFLTRIERESAEEATR